MDSEFDEAMGSDVDTERVLAEAQMERIHRQAAILKAGLSELGFEADNTDYFDTLTYTVGDQQQSVIAEGLWGFRVGGEVQGLGRRAVSRSRRAQKQVGVLVTNIEGLKNINQRFGYDAGDGLLAHFAQKLSEATYETDIVARLGIDEFVVVLEFINDELEVKMMREKILMETGSSFLYGVEEIPYTVNIGCTILDPAEGEDLLAAVNRADTEMGAGLQTVTSIKAIA